MIREGGAGISVSAQPTPEQGTSGVEPPDGAQAKPREELSTIHGRAFLAARAALDLKATDITILDMHELVTYTDYLLLCTGRSTRQTRRISEEIIHALKSSASVVPARVEGQVLGEWILLDYLDFIVHVFTPGTREFYRLDVLWKAAPAEAIEAPGAGE